MKFLFLCTGNSCRSILSEVLFNSRAPHDWKAYSAGSKPSGQVHPLTIETEPYRVCRRLFYLS